MDASWTSTTGKNHVVLDNNLIDRIRIITKLALTSIPRSEDFSRFENPNSARVCHFLVSDFTKEEKIEFLKFSSIYKVEIRNLCLCMTMDHDKLFEDALSNVIKDYSDNKIQFFSERDLQAHLFYECRKLMEQRDFPRPLKLYVEKSVFSKHAKVDLVLGDHEVLVELKLEPDYPGVSKPVVFSTKKEAAGSGSIESDLEKIEEYSRKCKFAHFLMIDEDGRHVKKLADKPWKAIHVKLNGQKRFVHYLHTKRDGRQQESSEN